MSSEQRPEVSSASSVGAVGLVGQQPQPVDLAHKHGPAPHHPPHVTHSPLAPHSLHAPHSLSLSLMRPAHQILQNPIIGSGGSTVTSTVVGQVGSGTTAIIQGTQIISQGTQGPGTVSTQGSVRLPAAFRLLSSVNLPTLPIQQHTHLTVTAPRSQNVGQSATNKQPTMSYHVPRGPAAVASLSVPRATATPRAPAPSPAAGWSATNAQIRPGSVVCTPRSARQHALQVTAAQRPSPLRPTTPQSGTTTTVVARAVRPANTPSPQRTPPPQVLQTVSPIRTTTPKVVPLVQRNYPAKVVGVTTIGVRPTISPRTSTTHLDGLRGEFLKTDGQISSISNASGGIYLKQIHSDGYRSGHSPAVDFASAYYYEVSSGVSNTVQQQNTGSASIVPSVSLSTAVHSMSVNSVPSHTNVNTFVSTGGSIADISRAPSSPVGPQRPSILRKRDNDGSPVKSQWTLVTSPPPSPGGSTTVSATSSPELDDEEPILPPIPAPTLPQQNHPSLNNCSPRKKPRKQLLSSEARGARGGECEFPSEGGRPPITLSPPPVVVPPPAPVPPETEKPPRLVIKGAMLGAGWRCAWRANALHFTRPTDVRRREERRPSVVELAAQKHVLQKANGWKVHHLTSQMDDLIELEAEVLQQATDALKVLEAASQPDLHRICELLKGNIQRSKIVCEGVAEARTNVLRIFQHKSRVSDILARQADKRCFKKHRNQY